MRVELHGVAYDVCDLVVTPVVQPLHGVQDTALDRLQAVVDVRDGALQNHVGSIVQKPVLVHSGKMVRDAAFRLVGYFVGRMDCLLVFLFGIRFFLFIYIFIVVLRDYIFRSHTFCFFQFVTCT